MKKFEGRDVIESTVAVTNAGDGLSAAMEIEPLELHLGDTVYIVIEATVSQIAYKPMKESRQLVRKQTLKAGVATIVDEAMVKEVLDDQRLALERAQGVERLDFGDEAAVAE